LPLALIEATQLHHADGTSEPASSGRSTAAPWGHLAVLVTALLLYNDVLSGVVRFVFSSIRIPYLSYLPFLITFAFALLYWLASLGRMRAFAAVTLCVVAVYVGLALLFGRSLPAVVFALYIWVPFYIGIIVVLRRKEERVFGLIPALWAIAVVGVVFNYFVPVPWTGTSYSVLGLEVQASLEWKAYEFDRIAGFSRGSFAAANQIAIFCSLLLAMPMRRSLKLLIWLLSVATITITTSKTPLMVVFIVPVALGVFDLLTTWRRGGQLAYRWAMATLVLLLLLTVGLPLVRSVPAFFDESVRVSFFTLASIGDRVLTTWPQAFALLSSDNNPLELLFGRGIGGIGTPQQFGELSVLNPADNLFVYLYVSVGAISFVFFAFILSGFRRIYRSDPPFFRMMFVCAVSMLTLAITSNVIESVTPCLLFGMVAAKGMAMRRTRGRRSLTAVAPGSEQSIAQRRLEIGASV
jgi:hypothetical protein